MIMKTQLLITGLAFMAVTTLASAQDQGATQKQQNPTGRGVAWVDANNDGICDNFEARKSSGFRGKGSGSMRGAGQGQRMRMGQCCMRQGRGYGRNLIDANKNGICDLRETPTKK